MEEEESAEQRTKSTTTTDDPRNPTGEKNGLDAAKGKKRRSPPKKSATGSLKPPAAAATKPSAAKKAKVDGKAGRKTLTKKERLAKKASEAFPELTLAEYVGVAEQAVKDLSDNAHCLEAVASGLRRASAEHMAERHQKTARESNERDAVECEKIAADLRSGKFLAEFHAIRYQFQQYADAMWSEYGIRTSLTVHRAPAVEEIAFPHSWCLEEEDEVGRRSERDVHFASGGATCDAPFTPVEQRLEEQLLQEFRCVWENLPPPMRCQVQDRCGGCSELMKVRQNEGVLVCPFCGAEAPNLDATSTMTAYGEEVEMPMVNSKRKAHFSDKLLFFRAQQPLAVPASVIRNVMCRLFNTGCRSTADVTYLKVGDAIKALRLKDYYDHKMKIACLVTGLRPPDLSNQDEDQCKKFFDAIMDPYERHKPPGRVNFISYNYCIFQFFRMLGLNHLLPYFCLLKDTDKLEVTEEVYKKICLDLDWQYSSSKDLMDRGGYEDGVEYVVPAGIIPPGERPAPPPEAT